MPLSPQKLKAARERRKLTQDQLAELSGIHRPNIARLEGGHKTNMRLETAERLANALKVSIDALLE